ncbi:alpha/beta hydrolase family protein [Prauserella flavalba]|uniref:alpha/beta hydrolase family protein n=1 Tax=Prauserella flavalba TaxID=1477506 RepID=UPI0036EFE891
MRRLWGALAAVLAVLLAVPATTAASKPRQGSHHGWIDGAEYRVEVPERWNGTLVLYSHGYLPPGLELPPGVALSTVPATERWLLDHGYALAASDFRGRVGFAVEEALEDQLALLDWFEENIGTPRTTVSSGMSMGGGIATVLAERNPHRIDGVLAQCAEYDFAGSWNTGLDLGFVVRELLAPDAGIELVKAADPQRSTDLLIAAVNDALTTPEGRAKLALAGALGNIPPWYSSHDPEPAGLVERITQQAGWTRDAYFWGIGPNGRADLEPRAGGNPSWNTGVDYSRQFARSAYAGLARKAYRAAGLDLRADLARLDAAPRIAADPGARAWLTGLNPRGATPAPVLTMHTTGDGGAVADQVRWYAGQVRRFGDPKNLRQLYVDRGGHCSFSAADEIVALRSLLRRVESGHWPDLRPRELNRAVGGFPVEPYQQVFDLVSLETRAMPPGFTHFLPPRFLRPSA